MYSNKPVKNPGAKPYNCNQCGSSFRQHIWNCINIYILERNPMSVTCAAAFTTLHYLKIHNHFQTGEKLYSCDQCGAAFTTLSNLKGPKRVHTEEKPYICHTCYLCRCCRYLFSGLNIDLLIFWLNPSTEQLQLSVKSDHVLGHLCRNRQNYKVFTNLPVSWYVVNRLSCLTN